jgi:hypothetical protein
MIEFSDIPTQPLFLPQSTRHSVIFADLPSGFCLITHPDRVSRSRKIGNKSLYFSDLVLFYCRNLFSKST